MMVYQKKQRITFGGGNYATPVWSLEVYCFYKTYRNEFFIGIQLKKMGLVKELLLLDI